eukprot:7129468-Alexandrium_andersonii.AAC.1
MGRVGHSGVAGAPTLLELIRLRQHARTVKALLKGNEFAAPMYCVRMRVWSIEGPCRRNWRWR